MLMPGRNYEAQDAYRFGFNGKQNDNDLKGEGSLQDYGMRMYDSRLGRFISIDPLTSKFPELSTYQFASNIPLQAIDQDGLEAWPVTRSWEPSDLENFTKFTQTEIQRIKEVQSSEKGKRLDREYNCADLAVAIYVRYAATNGLPITFKNHEGKILDSTDPKQYTFDPNNPQKSIDQYEFDARRGTSAASLVYNKDAINVDYSNVVGGDFYDSKAHVMVVRIPYADESVAENKKSVSYGNLSQSANSDYSDPIAGSVYLQESVITVESAKFLFYRFKELANAATNNSTPNQVPNQSEPENCNEDDCH